MIDSWLFRCQPSPKYIPLVLATSPCTTPTTWRWSTCGNGPRRSVSIRSRWPPHPCWIPRRRTAPSCDPWQPRKRLPPQPMRSPHKPPCRRMCSIQRPIQRYYRSLINSIGSMWCKFNHFVQSSVLNSYQLGSEKQQHNDVFMTELENRTKKRVTLRCVLK